eukprot:14675-Heterococcus_DN1.PRE.16
MLEVPEAVESSLMQARLLLDRKGKSQRNAKCCNRRVCVCACSPSTKRRCEIPGHYLESQRNRAATLHCVFDEAKSDEVLATSMALVPAAQLSCAHQTLTCSHLKLSKRRSSKSDPAFNSLQEFPAREVPHKRAAFTNAELYRVRMIIAQH